MVSREALELDELLRKAPKAVDMDLQHQREAGEHAEDMTSEPEGVRFEDAPQWEVFGLRRDLGTASRQSRTSMGRLRDLLASLLAQARRSPRQRPRCPRPHPQVPPRA